MQAARLLDTPLIVLPGMSPEELEAEWDAHVQRAQMTDLFLAGRIDPETYFDFMAEQGYEASELMDEAEANLEFAINEGIIIEK